MVGAHCSIAGGLHNALLEAQRLRMDCVQVFTKNQRQWRCPPLRTEQLSAWRDTLARMTWAGRGSGHRVVSHNCYLINLASPDAAILRKSLATQRAEMENCEQLGIPLLVTHPGAHLGEIRPRHRAGAGRPNGTPTRDEMRGLQRIARALDRLHRDLAGYRVITCLETTAGSGTNLGYDFHHLRIIRELINQPERLGFCMDTCHITAAGYDLTTDEKAAAVLDEWEKVCGLDHLLVLHVNDSKGAVGSRIDRHAHIGEGICGSACFRAVLNHPRLRGVPKILETPKGLTKRGTSLDLVNLRRLRRLMTPPGIADARGGPAPKRNH